MQEDGSCSDGREVGREAKDALSRSHIGGEEDEEMNEAERINHAHDDRSFSLSAKMNAALDRSGLTVDDLAERTKITRPTIRMFLGSTEPAVLPQRVYLRGHLSVLARELGMDIEDTLHQFDLMFPRASEMERMERPRTNAAATAIGVGLVGIGVFAVILAWIR